MALAVYTVDGMSCEHCVRSVTEEVSKIPGVDSVAVELAAGAVTVSSSQPVSDADVRAAVEQAGYTVVAG